jgi:hypothetical protein
MEEYTGAITKRNVRLKRWQREILHHQLKMLNEIFDMMIPFVDTFFPPIKEELELFRQLFMESLEASYLTTETTAFLPATYFAIARHIGIQLQKHIKVDNQFVFSTFCFRHVDYHGQMLDVIESIHHNPIVGHQIVFITYDHCKQMPFSKVAAIWNDRVYIPGAGYIGPLEIDTLNSLQDDTVFTGAHNMVFIRYEFKDEPENNDLENDSSDDSDE